jgi:hypothetical protein
MSIGTRNPHTSLVTSSSLAPHHQYLDPYSQPPAMMIPQESDHIPIDSYVIHGNGNRQGMHQVSTEASSHTFLDRSQVTELGMNGSKRLLFYLTLFIITIIVLINSALIVWIMTVINFSSVSLLSGHYFHKKQTLRSFCDKYL